MQTLYISFFNNYNSCVMKKYIYIIYTLCLLGGSVQAQVLFSEDFNSYNTGDLGTIHSYSSSANLTPNPPVAAQGGWFITEQYSAAIYVNDYEVKIEAETGRGNVLTLKSIPNSSATSHGIYISKVIGSETLWSSRNAGNDILKFEYDLYTGNLGLSGNIPITAVNLGKAKNNGFNFPNATDLTQMMVGRYYNLEAANIFRELGLGKEFNREFKSLGTLSDNSWVSIIMYIDYTTGYVYLEVPSMNKAIKSTTVINSRNLEIIDHVVIHLALVDTTKGVSCFVKYDNFKMSAVNTLSALILDIDGFFSSKFNVFPNPVTDVITITNSENIGIEQIEVFDISGKTVKSQSYKMENEVQLNIDNFASGTYLLHIKTHDGTAVKKVVKK